jgi:hypothetical protein
MRLLAKWVAITLLSVLLCEVVLILWGFAPTYSVRIQGIPAPNDQLRFELDRDRIFRLKPWPAQSINSWGYRDREFGPRREGVRRVVVVGDSFPMGMAVDVKQTFPKVLEELLGPSVEVLNLGVLCYGPDQELLVIKDEVVRLKPDIVLWSLYPGNDFSDVVRDRIFDLGANSELRRINDHFVNREVPWLKLQSFYQLMVHGRFFPSETQERVDEAVFRDHVHIHYRADDPFRVHGVPLVRKLIQEGRDFLSERKIKLGVLVIPAYEVVQNPERVLKEGVPPERLSNNEELMVELLNNLQIATVDLTPQFKGRGADGLYLDADRHFSVSGHRAAAEAVAELIRPML